MGSWQSLRPKPAPNLIIMDTMDILPTVDTMDGVAITDIPTDTGNVMLKLHPAPNLGTMDITAIPTDGAVTTEDITVTVTPDTDTGGNDLLMPMLMPVPNLTTTDTTAIPTDGAVTTEDITDMDTLDTTGDKSISPNVVIPT